MAAVETGGAIGKATAAEISATLHLDPVRQEMRSLARDMVEAQKAGDETRAEAFALLYCERLNHLRVTLEGVQKVADAAYNIPERWAATK